MFAIFSLVLIFYRYTKLFPDDFKDANTSIVWYFLFVVTGLLTLLFK